MVGIATNGIDNHLLTNEEFEADWREAEEAAEYLEDFDE